MAKQRRMSRAQREAAGERDRLRRASTLMHKICGFRVSKSVLATARKAEMLVENINSDRADKIGLDADDFLRWGDHRPACRAAPKRRGRR